MELFRLHAYAVAPQRTTPEHEAPEGGAVQINAELRATMDESVKKARFDQQNAVDFVFSGDQRQNEVRNLLLDVAFGEPPTAKSAASKLAVRLASSMDRRSGRCLLVVSCWRNGSSRRAVLWTFPRDEAFRLVRGSQGPSIDVLTDVFSKNSSHRKAARFEGRNIRTDFLSGMVVDAQAGDPVRDVAELWTMRFLACQPGIHDESGTRMLAKAVRRAFDQISDADGKEQLYTAMMAIRRSPNKRTSMADFAERFLDGDAKKAFLDVAPEEGRRSIFTFQTAVFDHVLKFRVFRLSGDVYVSSPMNEIGKSVKLRGEKRKVLSCEGEIVEEHMRTRHA